MIDLGDTDAVLSQLIITEEARREFVGAEIVAVRAIVGLSNAGAALMTDASHASSRDAARLSTRARAQLTDARSLMSELVEARR